MCSSDLKATSEPKVRQPVLRKVDLNLLTIFDTVMQEQSLTKAAHTLGMSQPAVSSAVSRLKVLFKDELFVRNGRGQLLEGLGAKGRQGAGGAKEQGSRAESFKTFHTTSREWANYMLARSVPACWTKKDAPRGFCGRRK